MTRIQPRETVVLAGDVASLAAWYRETLGFRIVREFTDGFHYVNLETDTGIRLGIASAAEMGVAPGDRSSNTVVLQFQVGDVKAFLAGVEAGGGRVTLTPTRNEKDGFWFGGFADPEGNPFWVVDENCP
jgi:predicted enzyme related to lactoylglutathione lyase